MEIGSLAAIQGRLHAIRAWNPAAAERRTINNRMGILGTGFAINYALANRRLDGE